jgi:hypothetical protein
MVSPERQPDTDRMAIEGTSSYAGGSDGGGKGKDLAVDRPIDPTSGWLALGGTVVMDDFTPRRPEESTVDDIARRYWFEHPAMRTTELRLSPHSSTLVGVRVR